LLYFFCSSFRVLRPLSDCCSFSKNLYSFKMMKIVIALSTLSLYWHVSLADCNGVYFYGLPLYPVDACYSMNGISHKFSCDDDNTGIYTYYPSSTGCSGSNMTFPFEVYANSSNNTEIMCTEETDCAYSTWTGYKDSTTDNCSDSDSGVYYSLPYVTECQSNGTTSFEFACGDDDEVALNYYSSDDCSGDTLMTGIWDSCLTSDDCPTDGALEMTVQMVVAVVMSSWLTMA